MPMARRSRTWRRTNFRAGDAADLVRRYQNFAALLLRPCRPITPNVAPLHSNQRAGNADGFLDADRRRGNRSAGRWTKGLWLGGRPGENAVFEAIIDPEPELSGNRFNDGKLGPDDRFYAGTMDDSEQSASGAFYVLDRSGEIVRLDEGFRVPNGPTFSLDGQTLYENDSALKRTYAYDLSKGGQLLNKRIFHQFSEDDGFPDGMTTDQKGNVWIAMWDGSRIQRLDAQGRKFGAIETPVQRPTNCVFIDERRLVFTSAAIGLPRRSPEDGGLFCADIVG